MIPANRDIISFGRRQCVLADMCCLSSSHIHTELPVQLNVLSACLQQPSVTSFSETNILKLRLKFIYHSVVVCGRFYSLFCRFIVSGKQNKGILIIVIFLFNIFQILSTDIKRKIIVSKVHWIN